MGLQLSKGISWTQATLNPIVGCTKCSPGCQHCWAVSQAHIHYRKHFTTPGGKDWNGKIEFFKDRLDFLRRWRTPTMIAVGLMTDLFHPSIPDDWLDVIFRYMLTYRQHTYQILTKRHERLLQYTTGKARSDWFQNARHIWWGVTVENQPMLDLRGSALIAAPVAVRFISVEPMLGDINIENYVANQDAEQDTSAHAIWRGEQPGLDWVICGGEAVHRIGRELAGRLLEENEYLEFPR